MQVQKPQNAAPQPKTPTKPSNPPFRVLNLQFASQKTFTNFLLTSIMIIVFPIASVLILNNWVKDSPDFSELAKVLIAVGPAVIFINIVMCVYVVKAMKDPENYQVDKPIKTNPKDIKQFAEKMRKKKQ